MSGATTLAPSATNRSATALPIPEPVPVTNATLSRNLPVMTTLLCSIVGVCRQSQHVTQLRDLFSRLADDRAASLFFSIDAPPIPIAQDLRIAAGQGRVQTLRARFRARIQVRKVGQQALHRGDSIGSIRADNSR